MIKLVSRVHSMSCTATRVTVVFALCVCVLSSVCAVSSEGFHERGLWHRAREGKRTLYFRGNGVGRVLRSLELAPADAVADLVRPRRQSAAAEWQDLVRRRARRRARGALHRLSHLSTSSRTSGRLSRCNFPVPLVHRIDSIIYCMCAARCRVHPRRQRGLLRGRCGCC